jgi:hypothetical protein
MRLKHSQIANTQENLPVQPGAIAELLLTLAILADTESILADNELSTRSCDEVALETVNVDDGKSIV